MRFVNCIDGARCDFPHHTSNVCWDLSFSPKQTAKEILLQNYRLNLLAAQNVNFRSITALGNAGILAKR